MNDQPAFVRHGLLPGAIAGLAGGVVFGAAMIPLGSLPNIAALIRVDSPIAGFVVHLAIALVLGVGFSWLVWYHRAGVGETLFWGLVYGAFWWFLGPLTLMPLLLNDALQWTVQAAQAAFPSLIGHLLYGATAALVLVLARPKTAHGATLPRAPISWGSLLRGAIAGGLSAWWVAGLLVKHDMTWALAVELTGQAVPFHLGALALGVLAGVGFSLLYPRPIDRAGPGTIRGTVYGFFWWVLGALTLIPLLNGEGLVWELAEVQAQFALLIGFLLFGALLAFLYQLLSALVGFLFAEVATDDWHEGLGTRGLRALGHGIVAGVAGGLLFTLVMLQVGFLPAVAQLVGSSSVWTGFFVHLSISILIGALYGLLFRGESYDLGSALGWGLSYGFVWWLLGSLTLMPMMLGGTPQWTAESATLLLSSLVGHFAYGAGLGISFHVQEARHNPWWIPRNRAESMRIERRRQLVLTSAPALWTLILVIALVIPVVLSMRSG